LEGHQGDIERIIRKPIGKLLQGLQRSGLWNEGIILRWVEKEKEQQGKGKHKKIQDIYHLHKKKKKKGTNLKPLIVVVKGRRKEEGEKLKNFLELSFLRKKMSLLRLVESNRQRVASLFGSVEGLTLCIIRHGNTLKPLPHPIGSLLFLFLILDNQRSFD